MLRNKQQIPDSVDLNKTDMIADDEYINFGEVDEDSDDDTPSNLVAKQERNLDMPDSDSEDIDIHNL